jgi:ribosome-binding protein aMBF1 (putative translation factor)
MIDDVLNNMRARIKAAGLTTQQLAKKAHISWATVRGADQDDWAPNVRTLRKIEAILPPDFEVPPSRSSDEAA